MTQIQKTNPTLKLILGSTSKYRKQLLEKSGLIFYTQKPPCDEDYIKDQLLAQKKTPLEIAEALSLAKLRSLQENIQTHDHALIDLSQNVIICADQLISFSQNILGKTPSKEEAFLQLKKLQNQTHELITSVIIAQGLETVAQINHISKMKMRSLTDQEILNYIELDKPFDCAGTYKVESYGISLFEKIETDDFTAIQGLPMLWLNQKLIQLGFKLFSQL